jgi:hypothetical protein
LVDRTSKLDAIAAGDGQASPEGGQWCFPARAASRRDAPGAKRSKAGLVFAASAIASMILV